MKCVSPIIILAASPRSGSTLIQRLLCSSRNTLIYGDPIAHEIEFILTYVESRKLFYSQAFSQIGPLREAVTRGESDHFIASLMPEHEKITKALDELIKPWIEGCSNDALEANRDLWGWKSAGSSVHAIRLLPHYFKDAKFISLRRDLIDVARSAKADGHFQCESGLTSLCQSWDSGNRALDDIEDLYGKRVMPVCYSDLVADPVRAVKELEEFTGAIGIDIDTFKVKINSTRSESYIHPMDLTETERLIVDSFFAT
ncbi:sulfotransferase [Luteolibacter sp. AS25]|uniref:sulfotransferase n=1 Tax=Luteolibacter sp. AS25 TaxID=3135776 RepID=UPI00398B4815